MMDMSSSSDMSGMSGSDSNTTMMGMADMQMTFFESHTTSLYSTAWTPNSTGVYAATCIFLIALSLIARFLFAWKAVVERRWAGEAYSCLAPRTANSVSSSSGTAKDIEAGREALQPSLSRNTNRRPRYAVLPWRLSTELPRAALLTVVLGVGYLL